MIKSVRQINELEACEKCSSLSTERKIANSSFDRSSVFEPYFEPALGVIIKSKEQKRNVCRGLGVEEAGTEPVENFYKNFEEAAAIRRDREWEAL